MITTLVLGVYLPTAGAWYSLLLIHAMTVDYFEINRYHMIQKLRRSEANISVMGTPILN